MKQLCTFLCILFPILSFAQVDTAKVDQYCEMIAQGRLFSNKITIDIDFGEGRSMFSFKDTRVKEEFTGKVKKFKSTIDALNFLAAKGWKLVNSFPVSESSGLSVQIVYHFYFVKTFDKKDLVENKMENN